MNRSLLAALLALAVAIPGLAQSAASHATYRDDPIVRDLKAGKLTVREARLLQEQRVARQQAAMAKAQPQPVRQTKSKAAIRKLTVAHANKAAKSSSQRHQKSGNQYSNKHGKAHDRQYRQASGKLHQASHPAGHPASKRPAGKAATHKKPAPQH